MPLRDAFESLVLLGQRGVDNDARFHAFETHCEYLCGNEAKECHHTGLVSYTKHDIGAPLLALVNFKGRATDFHEIRPEPHDSNRAFALPRRALVWPPERDLELALKDGEAAFTERSEGQPPYSYSATAPDYRNIAYPGTRLARLACNGVEFLLDGNHVLLMSYADYNLSKVRVLSAFKIGNATYYTVLLALKAYDAYGLLTRHGETWRFIVRPADWAMLC